ncbi:MAG: type II secretion system F family protein [Hellea sp.]|nr:type II secretion system F family protein [Hellea sp.]
MGDLITPQNIGYMVLSVMVVVTAFMLLDPLLEGDKLKKRMNSVSSTRDALKEKRLQGLNKQDVGLRSDRKGKITNIVDNLSLEKLLAADNLKQRLSQAGMRGQRPVYMFYFFRLAMPIILGVIGIIFLVGLNVLKLSMSQNALITVFILVGGYYLPGIFVRNAAGKRGKKIAGVFPDALDLLLICVESGMSVELAFGRVSQEMAENSVELAEEFSLTTAELSYLQSRRQAYENLARRNDNSGIKSVSTALVQSERYGTPLGDTLRTLATENRQMRVMAAEKKAAALPAKLTVPMILFFLPVLFIVILTPAGMRMTEAF